MVDPIIRMILMGIGMLIFLITGIFLIKKGFNSQQKNLVILGIGYVLMVIAYLLMAIYLVWRDIYIVLLLVYLNIIAFIQLTYYKSKKSPIKWITGLTIVIYAIMIILKQLYYNRVLALSLEYLIMDNILSILVSVLVFGWMAYATFQSINSLSGKAVEPWITVRMKMVAYSSVIEMFANVTDLLNVILWGPYPSDLDFIQLGITLFFIISQFLAWTMPIRFKHYLNRKIQDKKITSPEEDISAVEAMESVPVKQISSVSDKQVMMQSNQIVELMGGIIAESIKKSPIVCRGIFRLACKNDGKEILLLENRLKILDIEGIIQNGLKFYLNTFHISDFERHIFTILNMFLNSQSIVTMSQ